MADQNDMPAWYTRSPDLLNQAADEARRLRQAYVGVEHLFNALTRRPGNLTESLLRSASLDPSTVREALRREIGLGKSSQEGLLPLTPRLLSILERAAQLGASASQVEEAHILRAIFEEGQSLPVRYLQTLGHEPESFLAAMSHKHDSDAADRTMLSPNADIADRTMVSADGPASAVSSPPPASQEAGPGPRINSRPASPVTMPTPTLDELGRDLAKLARIGKLAEAIGRESEIQQVITILARTQKSNPLLLGEAGVGKTAIVEGLAWRIVNGQVPPVLRGKRIVELDVGGLMAGTSLRGQFEQRIKKVIEEAMYAPEVILFIDEIHTIVGAGKGDGGTDAGQMFKPPLARGDISCIGATTQDEYARYIRKDPALERRFSPVVIQEMSPEATLRVLRKVTPRILEKQASKGHALVVAPEALRAAVTLTDKYVRDRHQPDKGIDAIDIACARAVVQGVGAVTGDDIAKVVSDWTGIPAERLTADKLQRFAAMEATLSRRVVGQGAAVSAVSRCVRAAMAGLKPPNRPVGVFLFLGPSGVGKTKLAKELAAFLFDTSDALIRFDMSEYQEQYKVSNLLGSARGYIGSEQGGTLTEALRRRPYSVVLLDEIEKAHPDVFNIFLSAFDEGRITDNMGRVVDCSNALFILTSNLGIEGQLGFSAPDTAELRAQTFKFLRPELVNRITEVIRFAPLERAELLRILDLILIEKVEAFQQSHGLAVTADDAAKDVILASGFDSKMGARPLERAVDKLLVQPLVDSIFAGQINHAQIRATAREGRIVFVPAQEEAQP